MPDQNVELIASRTRSELLVQRQEEALDLFGKRQASQKRKCRASPRSDKRHGFISCFEILTVMNNHHSAITGHSFGDAPIDSGVGAGNEWDFVCQLADQGRPSVASLARVLGSDTATASSHTNPPNRVIGRNKEAGYQIRPRDESSPATAMANPKATSQTGSKRRK